ncbi:hypothetical protein R4796_02220 [Acinetobacter baumannii]|nr:hypothetical protein [Acinetobacter baumannii]
MNIEEEKFNFNTRDWIYIIIIVSMIQAAIWFLSYHFGTNQSALGYVSFAGTLISIILAVLAIGYTYGESVSQKNQSSELNDQIKALKKIKDKIQIQTDAMDEITNIKTSLFDYAEKVDTRFNETKLAIDKIDLRKNKENFIVEKSEQTESIKINNQLVFKKLFNDFSHFRLNVFLICILFLESKRATVGAVTRTKTRTKLKRFTARDFIRRLNIDIEGKNTTLSKDILFGGVVDMLAILNSLDLISDELDSIDSILIDKFNELLNNINDVQLNSFGGVTLELVEISKKSTLFESS